MALRLLTIAERCGMAHRHVGKSQALAQALVDFPYSML